MEFAKTFFMSSIKDNAWSNVGNGAIRLVSIIDHEFNLTDKELDLIVKGIWGGIDKVLNRRYKEIKNRHMIHPDIEY